MGLQAFFGVLISTEKLSTRELRLAHEFHEKGKFFTKIKTLLCSKLFYQNLRLLDFEICLSTKIVVVFIGKDGDSILFIHQCGRKNLGVFWKFKIEEKVCWRIR